MNKSLRSAAALLVATCFAGGAAMAQQPAPVLIEGVPTKTMPAPAGQVTSDHTRAEVRQEARRANITGEADQGGRVGADLGQQKDALGQYMHRNLTRAEVQAQARSQSKRIGGEADDLGRPSTM